jgi:hypothetical protein
MALQDSASRFSLQHFVNQEFGLDSEIFKRGDADSGL